MSFLVFVQVFAFPESRAPEMFRSFRPFPRRSFLPYCLFLPPLLAAGILASLGPYRPAVMYRSCCCSSCFCLLPSYNFRVACFLLWRCFAPLVTISCLRELYVGLYGARRALVRLISCRMCVSATSLLLCLSLVAVLFTIFADTTDCLLVSGDLAV